MFCNGLMNVLISTRSRWQLKRFCVKPTNTYNVLFTTLIWFEKLFEKLKH